MQNDSFRIVTDIYVRARRKLPSSRVVSHDNEIGDSSLCVPPHYESSAESWRVASFLIADPFYSLSFFAPRPASAVRFVTVSGRIRVFVWGAWAFTCVYTREESTGHYRVHKSSTCRFAVTKVPVCATLYHVGLRTFPFLRTYIQLYA